MTSSSPSSKAQQLCLLVEPPWHYCPSPYYNESHRAFQSTLRAFVDQHILPYINKWDEEAEYPSDLRHIAYQAGVYGALWPTALGGTPPPQFDAFHSLIWHDELARCCSGGLMASCFLPLGWALLPIVKYGIKDKRKQAQVCRECITGKATMALAVTEPTAGSDVSNIQISATLTTVINAVDGKAEQYYVINGEKYFISNGMDADYITLAVRTHASTDAHAVAQTETDTNTDVSDTAQKRKKKGKLSALSFVLIDVNAIMNAEDGQCGHIYRTKMKTQGWWLGNTTYLIFKNVRVPVSYTIGERDKGFIPILENFNHGRFAMASTAIRYSRCCLEDAIAFARKRHTFGQRLIDHQVIRHKMVNMSNRIEACQSLMEQITYYLKCGMSPRLISSHMARIKISASQCMEHCAREASQIFGGRSYLRGGTAARVERLYREVCVMGIAEGATEVLTDLIAKQAKL